MQDAALGLETSDIAKPDGIDKIITRLNKMYKKHELTQKYNAIEAFKTYRQKLTTTIRDFLTEFEK